MFTKLISLLTVLMVALATNPLPAQNVSRKLVICGGGSLPDSVFKEFRKLAGNEPSLVIIPSASRREYRLSDARMLWRKRGFKDVSIFHLNDRVEVVSDEHLASLRNATAIWIGGGDQQRIANLYLGTNVEAELMKLAEQGVVIGGSSAGAAIQSGVMIAGGKKMPEISQGFDLLPDAIIDQHFLRRNRMERLGQAVRSHAKRVGFGIDEGTALILNDGKLKVLGHSYVICIRARGDQLSHDSFKHGDVIELRN